MSKQVLGCYWPQQLFPLPSCSDVWYPPIYPSQADNEQLCFLVLRMWCEGNPRNNLWCPTLTRKGSGLERHCLPARCLSLSKMSVRMILNLLETKKSQSPLKGPLSHCWETGFRKNKASRVVSSKEWITHNRDPGHSRVDMGLGLFPNSSSCLLA